MWSTWAHAAASRGLVAIAFDLRFGSEASDFQALTTYLATRGATVEVNQDAIAVYAGSGNVFTALPLVEDPKLTAVKAAVMHYGEAPDVQNDTVFAPLKSREDFRALFPARAF